MLIDMVRVRRGATAAEAMVDRRTGRTWTVDVRTFDIATTVVTLGQWNALLTDASVEDVGVTVGGDVVGV